MTILNAIDPGINGAGFACFVDGHLHEALYVPSGLGTDATLAERVAELGITISRRQPPDVLVTECPQIYSFGKGKGDPNKLIPLAQLGAYVAARFPLSKWVQYRPREWKGTLDGDAMTERIKTRVTALEEVRFASFKRGGLDHNTWDAVGLGLYHLGRLTPRNVYPR